MLFLALQYINKNKVFRLTKAVSKKIDAVIFISKIPKVFCFRNFFQNHYTNKLDINQ